MDAKQEPTEVKQDAASRLEVDTEEALHIDPIENRRVVWKLDLVLMPVLGFCYMLNFLDKSALNYSTLLGVLTDTGLKGNQYSWTSAIFYFGYLFWSAPVAYLIVRFPIGKYLGITVLAWAIVMMSQAACSNFGGLATARFFLGVTEAAVAPGFSLLTSIFYTRSEQAFRHGIWFLGNSIATIIGGITAYSIGDIHSSLAAWRIVFLIFGGITAFWSIVMFLLLPDNPASIKWFNAREREIAIARSFHSAKTTSKTTKFKGRQAREALMDPQAWCLIIYVFATNITNGGVGAFSSLILSGLGFTGKSALIWQMPIGASQFGFILIGSVLASKFKSYRLCIMLLWNTIGIAGVAMMFAPDQNHLKTKYAGFCLSAAYSGNFPLLLSVTASNVAGFSKRAAVNAMVFVAFCVGNIAGPQFFVSSEAPKYTTGVKSMLSGLCVGNVALIALLAHYIFMNMRRNRRASNTTAPPVTSVGEDDELTDWQDQSFRYLL